MNEEAASGQVDQVRSTIKRPLSITIVGWLFVAVGVVGFVYHSSEFKTPLELEFVGVLFVRLLAIVGGVYLLRGRNWARWLLVIWLGYHVVLSAFHTLGQMVTHFILLGVIGYFLFRRKATDYFRRLPSTTDIANGRTRGPSTD